MAASGRTAEFQAGKKQASQLSANESR